MKLYRKFFLFSINLLFLAIPLSAQSDSASQTIHVAWIANPEINEITEDFRDKTLQLIDEGAQAIIITGKLTEHSSLKEFAALKKFIKELPVPVKVLPSYSDLYSNPYSELNYNEYFDDRNFLYIKDNISLLGLNLLSPFSDSFGHFSPNQENWLKSETEDIKDSSLVLLFTNFTPNQVDNWQNVEAALSMKRIPTIFLNSSPNEISNKYYFIYPNSSNSIYKISINNRSVVMKNITGDSIFVRNIPNDFPPLEMKKIPSVFQTRQLFVKKIWQNNIASTTTIATVIYKGRYYLLQNDGLLTCFDKDGSEFWDYDLLADVRVNPAIIDGFFVAATLQGDLFSLNASNGDQLQTIGFESPITTDLLLLEFPVKVQTMAAKTSGSNGVVIFGNAKGKLFCYDVETFEKVWETNLSENPLVGKILFSGNQVFVHSKKRLFAVDLLNGTLLWRWNPVNMNDEISGNPVQGKVNLFLTTDKGRIVSLDKKLGTINWKADQYRAIGLGVSSNGKFLYVKDADDKLILTEINSGKFKKSFPIKSGFNNITNEVQNQNELTFVSGKYSLFRIKNDKKFSEIISSVNSPITYFKYFGRNKLLMLNQDGVLALFEIYE